MKILKFFEKEFEKIDENDLHNLEKNPMNFESFQIEYKLKFNGKAAELRKDIMQFANGFEKGYIIFGISDDPISVVGIEKSEVDGLKTILNDLLTKKIEPPLSPRPKYHVVPLANGKYVVIINITPKEQGIYGIRQSDNVNNNYYEFYIRIDGSKHRMNIESIVNLIEKKSSKKWRDKFLDVKLRKSGHLLIAKAVNKSERPIVVTHYRFLFPSYSFGRGSDKSTIEPGKLEILQKGIVKAIKLMTVNPAEDPLTDKSNYPIKLEDGESLSEKLNLIKIMNRISSYYEDRYFNNEIMNDLSSIQCCFYTNDGKFYSDTIEIKSDIKKILKSKRDKKKELRKHNKQLKKKRKTSQKKL